MATQCRLFWCFLILLVLSNSVSSQTIVKTLPGFEGNLPFFLETGYIGVGEMDEIQLFYYFFKSERKPNEDPLVLWLPTGPGCSALSSILYENGPIRFNYKNSSIQDKPVLELNIYSWTKVANVIFLDAPVGSGFSYSTVSSGYNTSDTKTVSNIHEFIRKWLLMHPEHVENQLVIGGESYSGIIAPAVVQKILDGNAAKEHPWLNIQTLVVGNPFTDVYYDINSRVKFADRVALISDDLYEQAKFHCHGEYVHPNRSNTACAAVLEMIHRCLEDLNAAMILENKCAAFSPRPKNIQWDLGSLGLNLTDSLFSEANPITYTGYCRKYNYLFASLWANDLAVQEALNVRNGTIEHWERCNNSIAYTHDIKSSLHYYKNFLSAKPLRVLVYSGDHDLIIPYVGTEEWIASLNMTISTGNHEWRPWYVDGQVAGYTEIYTKKEFRITYATVKGAGHTAPEYKPKQCYNMIERYLAYFFL
ncbi:serine carboxypeptidase-like 12 isoform X1 [Neltuma alba]|uniref:serine carboxypeptidase-like 12 isoform X1 n=1 Tax=Neltuma alba TaxID=207710 RepID=UPI0010A4BEC4|nr:serine carboxypeptidase-like 12 isoform X1 [Prosopis alba]